MLHAEKWQGRDFSGYGRVERGLIRPRMKNRIRRSSFSYLILPSKPFPPIRGFLICTSNFTDVDPILLHRLGLNMG